MTMEHWDAVGLAKNARELRVKARIAKRSGLNATASVLSAQAARYEQRVRAIADKILLQKS